MVQRMQMAVCRLTCGTSEACGARFLRKRAWRCVVVCTVEVELKSGFQDYAGLNGAGIRYVSTPPARRQAQTGILRERLESEGHERGVEGLTENQFKLQLPGNTLLLPSSRRQPSLHVNMCGWAAATH